MQTQRSSAPAPVAPVPVERPAPQRTAPGWGRWLRGLGVLLILVVASAAAWLWQKRAGQPAPGQQKGVPAVVRTYRVAAGTLDRTIRLTGTTAAERFSMLLAPQLRGSRSGFGRGGPSGTFSRRSGSSGSSSGSSASSGDSGSSSRSSSSSSAASMAASSSASRSGGTTPGATGSATGVAASRGATALRAATTRSSRSSSSSRSSARTTAAAVSAAMGDSGLGSTASGLSGGSGGPPSIGGSGRGGGGGGGEFSLLLQKVVPAGQLARKGDIVAEFDRQYMINRLDDYKASVIQTEASFKTIEADLGVSKNAHGQTLRTAAGELGKAKLDMKTTPVVSAIEAERLKLALEEAEARNQQLLKEVKFFDLSQKAERRNAELELQQAQVELRRAEANANRMVIQAPIDGLVVMQNTFRGTEFDAIKQGDQLWPGMPFMQIVDPSSMVINATVNQVDGEKLRIGMKATIGFDAFPDLALTARIHSVGTVAKSSRYRPDFVKELGVVLKLDKMDPRVIPDLSVSCDVVLESGEQAAVLPLEAVFYEDGPTPAPYVHVRAGNGWERRRIQLGLSNNVRVAVLSGLTPGETVALEKPPAPRAGT